MKRKFSKDENSPYEPPKNANLVIDIDKGETKENISKLTSFVKESILRK